jgi:hypothetical protein
MKLKRLNLPGSRCVSNNELSLSRQPGKNLVNTGQHLSAPVRRVVEPEERNQQEGSGMHLAPR